MDRNTTAFAAVSGLLVGLLFLFVFTWNTGDQKAEAGERDMTRQLYNMGRDIRSLQNRVDALETENAILKLTTTIKAERPAAVKAHKKAGRR